MIYQLTKTDEKKIPSEIFKLWQLKYEGTPLFIYLKAYNKLLEQAKWEINRTNDWNPIDIVWLKGKNSDYDIVAIAPEKITKEGLEEALKKETHNK